MNSSDVASGRGTKLRRTAAAMFAAWALLLCVGAAQTVWAQTSAPTRLENRADDLIAGWDRTAAAVRSAIDEQQINVEALERLRVSMADQRRDARALAEALAAEVAPLRAQLAALGPPPEDGAEEVAEIAQRRSALNAQIEALASRRQAAELAVARAEGLEAELTKISRAVATQRLLLHKASIFEPSVWTDAPRALASVASGVAQSVGATALKLDPLGAHLLHAAAIVGAVLLLFASLPWRIRQEEKLLRNAVERSGFMRGFAAVGVAVVRVTPVALIGALIAQVLMATAAVDGATQALLLSSRNTLLVLSGAIAAIRLALSPRAAALRVAPISDDAARRAARISIAYATGAAVFHILSSDLAGAETFAGPAVLAASLLALATGPLLAHLAQQHFRRPAHPEPEESAVEDQAPHDAELGIFSSLLAAARLFFTAVGLGAPITAMFGYIRLSEFLIVGAGATMLIVLSALLLFYALTHMTAPVPVNASASSGDGAPSRAQMSQGLARLAIGAILTVLVAPAVAFVWGMSETDLKAVGLAIVEGVQIGEQRFSPADLLLALGAVLLGIWATRLIQGVLRSAVLPTTRMDVGARSSVLAGVGYLGFFLTALFAISTAGLDLSNLAIVAGALSVGIGFGLQNVVNNFVSGLILLFERPIRVGDLIVVGDLQGYVRRINVRSTEVETFDRAAVIVPNSDLISNKVVNWTHKDLTGRAIVSVGVSYDADPDQVMQILREAAQSHPLALRYPGPVVTFAGFGASSLDFEARVYIRDVNRVLVTTSELNLEILKRLREANIEIPYPQRDVHVRTPAEASAYGEPNARSESAPE